MHCTENHRIMIWSGALLFMFVGVSVSSKSTSSDNNMNEWPYSNRRRVYAEQSPVNINGKDAQKRYLPPLCYFGYKAFKNAELKIVNNGHTVEVKYANESVNKPYIKGGPLFNDRYEFVQMHLHWGEKVRGSEHCINGYVYAIEIHVVHFKTNYGTFENALNFSDGLCVVAFFGEIFHKDNPDISNFIADLRNISTPNKFIIRKFEDDFSWIHKLVLNQHYYTYHGSLTTAPFTECVNWILFTRPLKISREQLSKLRTLQSDTSKSNGGFIRRNDRDLQPLNNRVVIYQY